MVALRAAISLDASSVMDGSRRLRMALEVGVAPTESTSGNLAAAAEWTCSDVTRRASNSWRR